MFVWIPRYSYSIKQYKTVKNNTEGITADITEVTFLKGVTNKDKEEVQYPLDYNVDLVAVGNATPKIVHPAFAFGETEITGFWAAKFEASMKEANNNTQANNNVTNKTVKVVPNAESWRLIQIGTIFDSCLSMNKENNNYGLSSLTNTHMMKNMEWGAISYFAGSQYGVVPTFNASGSNYVENGITKTHSYSAGGDYKTNKLQSSTGNETGIYDLNGGAWEYVAGYYDNENSNLGSYGTAKYFEGNKVKEEYKKYWDIYKVSELEITEDKAGLWDKDKTYNKVRKQITMDRYDLMKPMKGDGMYENINTYSYHGKKKDGNYEWGMDESFASGQYGRTFYNEDYGLIGNCLQPFVMRGGHWLDYAGAGAFTSISYFGYPFGYIGFRPVVVAF